MTIFPQWTRCLKNKWKKSPLKKEWRKSSCSFNYTFTMKKKNCLLISSDIWPTPASYSQYIQNWFLPKTWKHTFYFFSIVIKLFHNDRSAPEQLGRDNFSANAELLCHPGCWAAPKLVLSRYSVQAKLYHIERWNKPRLLLNFVTMKMKKNQIQGRSGMD